MSPRPALAVSLYVLGRRCLVVGDDAIAAERAGRLTDAGADVVRVSCADFRVELLEDVFMVFCCDAALGPAVAREGRARGALVYVLDRPEISDCAMPALVRRGPLQLAISTDGQAPALARRLREELERLLASGGALLDVLVAALARAREETAVGARRELLYRMASRLSIEGKIEIAPER
jgi:precorrin-2 dehydrogenase / sirohydrochlorin ferrochelatase